MFLPFEERRGDTYELQYCREKKSEDKLFVSLQFWKEDSLYIDSDDVEIFDEFYYKYFEKCQSPDKSGNFSPYGPNYYDKVRMEEILEEVKKDAPPEGNALIYWLSHKPIDCEGFYFLGI